MVESEKPIQEPTLQSMIPEELTQEVQFQGESLGPQLHSVRFSELSPEPPLQGERLLDLISGSPHHSVTSDELTPRFPNAK